MQIHYSNSERQCCRCQAAISSGLSGYIDGGSLCATCVAFSGHEEVLFFLIVEGCLKILGRDLEHLQEINDEMVVRLVKVSRSYYRFNRIPQRARAHPFLPRPVSLDYCQANGLWNVPTLLNQTEGTEPE